MGWERDGAGRIKGGECPAAVGQNNLIERLTRVFYRIFFPFALTGADSALQSLLQPLCCPLPSQLHHEVQFLFPVQPGITGKSQIPAPNTPKAHCLLAGEW